MALEAAAQAEAAEWAVAEMAVIEDELEAWKQGKLQEMAMLFPLYSPDWARDIVQGAIRYKVRQHDQPKRLNSCSF
jgi:hypothetical protein